jgi:alkyl hydroperoxide reductase subunit AhpC
VKVVGLSIDATNDHERWAKDIEETQGAKVNFPMIGDPELKIAKLYNMLPAAAGGAAATRTAADNMTVRNVFVIGPDKKVKLILVYPMSAGRNFDEILRVIDALQLNAKQNLATPADWRPGQAAIIPTSVKDEDAKKLFPQGWKTLKPYLRIVQPK